MIVGDQNPDSSVLARVWHCNDFASTTPVFAVGDRDAVFLEHQPGCALQLDASLFVGRFGGHECRLRHGQVVLGGERLLIGSGAQFLFLLHDIECALSEIARLPGGIHAAGTLLQRVACVAHFNHNVLLQLFNVHLRLAILELGAVLVGLGDPIAQRHLKLETHLVLRRRVVERILDGSTPSAGSGITCSKFRVRNSAECRSGVKAINTELRQEVVASRLAGQLTVAEVESVFLYFSAILKSVSDPLLYRLGFRLYLSSEMIRRHYWHLLKYWIVERTGDGVLHVEFLQFEVGASDRQVLLARGHFAFGFQHIHLRNSLEGELLAASVKSLCGKGNRALTNLLGVVGVYKVPVDIADLGDGRDDLRLEGDVSNLFVGPGDS